MIERAMGIDPGLVRTGYGIIEKRGGANRYYYIQSGTISTAPSDPFPQRLEKIYTHLLAVIKEYSPHIISIEKVFVSKNYQSALKLGHARAAAILAAVNSHIPVHEYSATEIKSSLLGYGHADKEQIQLLLKSLLSLSRDLIMDEADAMACAICYLNKNRLIELIEKGYRV